MRAPEPATLLSGRAPASEPPHPPAAPHRIQRNQQRPARFRGNADPRIPSQQDSLASRFRRFRQIQQRHRLQLRLAFLKSLRTPARSPAPLAAASSEAASASANPSLRACATETPLSAPPSAPIMYPTAGRQAGRSQFPQQRRELQLRKQRPARGRVRRLRPHRLQIQLQRHLAVESSPAPCSAAPPRDYSAAIRDSFSA